MSSAAPREGTEPKPAASASGVGAISSPPTASTPAAATPASARPSASPPSASSSAAPTASTAATPPPACVAEVFGPIEKGARCAADKDCEIVAGQCCTCGALGEDEVHAVRVHADPFCPERNGGHGVGCGRCAGSMPAVDAVCVAGSCRKKRRCPDCSKPLVFPLGPGTTAQGATCSQDDECMAAPKVCCHCGEQRLEDLHAIRRDAASSPGACSGTRSCPDCTSQPNPAIGAVCNAGTCQLGRKRPRPGCPPG